MRRLKVAFVFCLLVFFFFNDTATTEIYTLSLHDALPISNRATRSSPQPSRPGSWIQCRLDRKSTRLNSSHLGISYAVFCFKKKNKTTNVPLLAVARLQGSPSPSRHPLP